MPCFESKFTPQSFFKDSLNNKLILGFSHDTSICGENFRALVSFNGSYFEDLDRGLETHIGNPTPGSCFAQTCVSYKNRALYGGWFHSVGSNKLISPGLSYWDGSKWDTMEKKPFKFYSNKGPSVASFFNDNGKLWIGGILDTVANIPVDNLCYFDGSSYYAGNMSSKKNEGVGQIIKYKNEIYLSGLFQNLPGTSYSRIVRYANSLGAMVGNGIQGGFASVQDMVIYKDTLYVAGAFSQADGNVGNHIMKWDGSQFYDAGFGSFHDWGAIYRLLILKDRLYAFGTFTYAADEKAFGAAYYENGKWFQSKDSTNLTGIVGAEILNGQIYATGSFKNINGDPNFEFFVRLKCPDFDGCINDPVTEFIDLNIYPNPFTDIITIESSVFTNLEISVVNTLGQKLQDYKLYAEKSTINLETLPEGIYYLKVKNGSKQKVVKIIRQNKI